MLPTASCSSATRAGGGHRHTFGRGNTVFVQGLSEKSTMSIDFSAFSASFAWLLLDLVLDIEDGTENRFLEGSTWKSSLLRNVPHGPPHEDSTESVMGRDGSFSRQFF